MAKFRYSGTDERVFPTLGITVLPQEEFDAPEGFAAHDVTAAAFDAAKKSTKSASSDMTEGE